MGLILNPLTGQFDFVNFVPAGSGNVTGVSNTNSIHLTLTATIVSADLQLANSTLAIVAGGVKVATGGITNNEISATAAISFSKLAPLTNAHILVGNAGNVATDVAVSGDLSLVNTGAFTVNTVGGSSAVNIHTAELAANAATDANTVGTIVKRDGSGNFSAGIVSVTRENVATYIQFSDTTVPSTPSSTFSDLFVDNSNGFSRLRFLESSGMTTTVGRDSFNIVYNNSGSTITKGKVVYFTGVNGGIGTIALAKADSITTSPGYGLTAESIANNSYGRVQFTGVVNTIDTSAFSAGQIVYLSATTAGALVGTKPLAPNIAQTVAVILTNAVSGSLTLTVRDNQNVSSGSNTGFALNVVALTDAATIATDVSLGNVFTVTLGGNRTLGNPTNSRSGQKVVWRIRQDGTGNRTLAYGSDFRFGTDILTPVLTTVANKTDYIGAIYHATDAKWDVVAVVQGY